MSRTKQHLPEDYDITVPEQKEPEQILDDDMPDYADFQMLELGGAIYNLEKIKPYYLLDELKVERDRLNKLINDLEKPF